METFKKLRQLLAALALASSPVSAHEPPPTVVALNAASDIDTTQPPPTVQLILPSPYTPSRIQVVTGTVPSGINYAGVFSALPGPSTCTAQIIYDDPETETMVGAVADHCIAESIARSIVAQYDSNRFEGVGVAVFRYSPDGDLSKDASSHPIWGVSRSVIASSTDCMNLRCPQHDIALFLIHRDPRIPVTPISFEPNMHVGDEAYYIGYGRGSTTQARQFTGRVSSVCLPNMICLEEMQGSGFANYGDSGAAMWRPGPNGKNEAVGILARATQDTGTHLTEPRFATFEYNQNYLKTILSAAQKGSLYIAPQHAPVSYTRSRSPENGNTIDIFSTGGEGIPMAPDDIVNLILETDTPNVGCRPVITNLKSEQTANTKKTDDGKVRTTIEGTVPIQFSIRIETHVPGDNCRGSKTYVLDVLNTYKDGTVARALPISAQQDTKIALASDVNDLRKYQVYIPVFHNAASQGGPRPTPRPPQLQQRAIKPQNRRKRAG